MEVRVMPFVIAKVNVPLYFLCGGCYSIGYSIYFREIEKEGLPGH